MCVCVCIRPLRLLIVICDRKCDRKFSCFVSSRASYVWRSGGCSPACFNVLHVLCHVPLQCSQLAGTRCVVCTMPKRANSCARWPAMTAPSQLFRSLPFPSPLSPFTFHLTWSTPPPPPPPLVSHHKLSVAHRIIYRHKLTVAYTIPLSPLAYCCTPNHLLALHPCLFPCAPPLSLLLSI